VMMAKRVMDSMWKIVWRWRGRVGKDVCISRELAFVEEENVEATRRKRKFRNCE